MLLEIKENTINTSCKAAMNIKKGAMTTALLMGLSLTPAVPTIASEFTQDSREEIRKLAYGHLPARALHVSCFYKLFDDLQSGPKLAEEIAQEHKLHADPVRRLMHVLANHGIIAMDDKNRFSLTDRSKILVSSVTGSFQPALAKEFDHRRWNSLGHINIALEQDKIPFEALYNETFYEYAERDRVAGELFNAGMKNFSEREDAEVSTNFNFSQFRSYCDIGGGTGGLIDQVIKMHPTVRSILFDLEGAVNKCSLPNVTKVSGSFFDKVPAAEVYTVKRVLHNWNDADCIKILSNIKASLIQSVNARVLVIERVILRKFDGSFLVDGDLIGMALGGVERSLGEFIKLGKATGLELEEQTMLPSGVSVMTFKFKEAERQ